VMPQPLPAVRKSAALLVPAMQLCMSQPQQQAASRTYSRVLWQESRSRCWQVLQRLAVAQQQRARRWTCWPRGAPFYKTLTDHAHSSSFCFVYEWCFALRRLYACQASKHPGVLATATHNLLVSPS